MTAKEFDKKFWNNNNPITTPLWKCMEAYYQYKIKQVKNNVVLANVKIMEGELITYCGYTQSNRNKLEIMVCGVENYMGNNLKSGDTVEVRHYR